MAETRYSAQSVFNRPRLFLAEAFDQLRRSLPIVGPLFLSNMRARHRALLLSYAWLLIPAIATAVICTHLKSLRVIASGPTSLPYVVHVLAGTLLWQSLVEALNSPLQQLRASRQVILNSRTPHEALILSGALEVLLNGGVRLLVLVPVLIVYGIMPSASWLAVPLAVLAILALGLAIGLLLAPWGLLYDDVSRGTTLAVTLWFFLTPIFYGRSSAGVLRFNPATPLIETGRAWLSGGAAAPDFLPVAVGSLIALVAGWLLYRLARPHVLARMS